ncbi:MAG TPA: ATP-binding protein [Kofleriaceae bacterium]|jgi:PAS domain S-box-containing protein
MARKSKYVLDLEARLQEAEETLEAIRTGQVDALVVQGPDGSDQVFTLKGADHRYRLLVETMTEGALLVAPDSTILYANQHFAELLGRPLETIIGTRLDTHVVAVQAPMVAAVLAAKTGLAGRAEILLSAVDRQVPAYLAVTPGAGETPTCVIVTDLSSQKRDQELLAAERLASTIVEQSADSLVVCDGEGRVMRASASAQHFASGNPFLVQFEEAFALCTPADEAAGQRLVQRALHGQTVTGQELCLMRERQEPVDVLLSAGPISNMNGTIVGCVISFIDITERKRAAEERTALLERAQQARDEAESASRAKDEFLAMLGHELRNPLAPILTALELMHMKGDASTERERSMIERHVKDVVRLVGDLLDVSRIAQGKVELDRHPVDTAQLIQKSIEAAGPLVESKAHHLTVSAAPDIWIDADANRISQVLSNLLTNAAKYTPRGGHISIKSTRVEDDVVITVTDDGVGIGPELLPRLFDLFVQGGRTLDRSAGGLGLGLSIVRNLIRIHGGTVVARSDGEGRGSEMEVRLPALPATYAMKKKSASDSGAQPKRGTGTRVLIVDDNRDAADLLTEALDSLGYEARTAYDGPSALEVAAEFEPQVALLDIGLPVMDGYELARRMRERITSGLHLIALTGYGSASDRVRSSAAGFDAHLVKPLDLTKLAVTLKQLSA